MTSTESRTGNIVNMLMAIGHCCSDMNQGALSAVLPFLIAQHHYGYATASALVMASNIVGSVVQPAFGHIADRFNRPMLIGLGLLLACTGMAMVGVMPGFAGLVAAVIVSGVGVAMFHPQAARLVNKASTRSRAAGNVALFSFGGNVGFALGPVLVTATVGAWGLPGMLAFAIPGLAMMIIIAVMNGLLHDIGKTSIVDTRLTNGNEAPTERWKTSKPRDDWRSFAILCGIVFARSVILYGCNTFLALHWADVSGADAASGNIVLSIFFAAGALATLLGGYIADRWGLRRCIIIGFTTLPFLLAALAYLCSAVATALLVVPLGVALSMVYSPIVVSGQRYLPNHVGLSSGVTLGLAVSVGGVTAPLLGMVADRWGLDWVFATLAATALIPAALSWILPEMPRPAHSGK